MSRVLFVITLLMSGAANADTCNLYYESDDAVGISTEETESEAECRELGRGTGAVFFCVGSMSSCDELFWNGWNGYWVY